jgi:hypothetical protein
VDALDEIVAPRGSVGALFLAIERTVQVFDAAWARQPKPGRPNTRRRNQLLADLATVFDKHTTWTERRQYRVSREDFLRHLFAAYNLGDLPARLSIKGTSRRVP